MKNTDDEKENQEKIGDDLYLMLIIFCFIIFLFLISVLFVGGYYLNHPYKLDKAPTEKSESRSGFPYEKN